MINYFQKRLAFFLPFFIYACYFKHQGFSFSRWYYDLTALMFIFLFFAKSFQTLCKIKKISFRRYNPVLFIVMPFMFFVIITLLTSCISPLGFVKIRDLFIVLIPSILLAFWVLRSDNDLFYFSNGFLVFGIFVSIDIFFMTPGALQEGAQYLFGATIASLAGLISLNRFLTLYKNRIMYFIILLVCTIGVLNSHARGQILIFISLASLIVSINIGSKVRNGKIPTKMVGCFLLLFLVLPVCYASYDIKQANGIDILSRFHREYLESAIENRLEMAYVAFESFANNPIIPAGVGSYCFEVGGKVYRYPHNIILEIMAELGIVGAIYRGCSEFCVRII